MIAESAAHVQSSCSSLDLAPRPRARRTVNLRKSDSQLILPYLPPGRSRRQKSVYIRVVPIGFAEIVRQKRPIAKSRRAGGRSRTWSRNRAVGPRRKGWSAPERAGGPPGPHPTTAVRRSTHRVPRRGSGTRPARSSAVRLCRSAARLSGAVPKISLFLPKISPIPLPLRDLTLEN